MMYERMIYTSNVSHMGNPVIKVIQMMNVGSIPSHPIKVLRLVGDKYIILSQWLLSEADAAVGMARRAEVEILKHVNNVKEKE